MLLTQDEYNKKIKLLNIPYWNESGKYRWKYIQPVRNILSDIGAEKILECGCMGLPINSTSTLIELSRADLVTESGIIHDLNNLPLPFENKTFDCVVMLQVFEHLKKQPEIFKELQRISKNIILSFPYRWTRGDGMHKGITPEKISQWTCGVYPDKKIIIQFSKNKTDRAVYLWKVK